MNWKKCIWTLFVLSLSTWGSFQVQAQEESTSESGVIVRIGVGYGMPVATDILGLGIYNRDIDTDGDGTADGVDVTTANMYGSYGGGLSASVDIGYQLNRHFGVLLGAEYLSGSEVTVEEVVNYDMAGVQAGFDRSVAYTTQVKLKPALMVSAGTKKINPFAKVGLLIPVAGATYGTRESNDPSIVSSLITVFYPNATSFIAESTTRGAFGIGYEGTIGANFELNDKLAVFGEVFGQNLRIRRASYEVTRADLIMSDGSSENVTALLGLGGAYEYTEYFDEYSSEALAAHQAAAQEAYTQNPNQELEADPVQGPLVDSYYGTKEYPAWETRLDGNFSNFGLKVGVKFLF